MQTYICQVQNSRLWHDLTTSVNDRVISTFFEGFIYAKLRVRKVSRKENPRENFRSYSIHKQILSLSGVRCRLACAYKKKLKSVCASVQSDQSLNVPSEWNVGPLTTHRALINDYDQTCWTQWLIGFFDECTFCCYQIYFPINACLVKVFNYYGILRRLRGKWLLFYRPVISLLWQAWYLLWTVIRLLNYCWKYYDCQYIRNIFFVKEIIVIRRKWMLYKLLSCQPRVTVT